MRMSLLLSTTSIETSEWHPFLIPTEDEHTWFVEDAEEEMFLLYSQLQGASARQGDPSDDGDNDASKESGLGSVNPKDGQITVILPICRCRICNDRRIEQVLSSYQRKKSRGRTESLPPEISLYQDITSLNSRRGDTGSVLWRASKKIAASILSGTLMSHAHLSNCQILELGAGTGFLAIALGPLVNRYVATDLPYLIPLIAKNISQNTPPRANVSISTEALDWVEFQSLPLNKRLTAYKDIWTDNFQESYVFSRVILAIDCIYNPSLVDPLLAVINHFACNGHKAIVLVVLELRAEEVTRLFLSRWLVSGQWEIRSLGVLGAHFAVWVGRQKV